MAVTEDLVDGLEGSAIPLFVGWRDAPRSESAAGRAAQLMQILREWRGGVHLVATTAVGLSPLEAILTNEGPGQAKFFGWPEPFPEFAAIKDQHEEAEAITDRLCASALAGAAWPGPGTRTSRPAVSTLRAATPRGPRGLVAGRDANPGRARVKGCSAAGLARTEGALAVRHGPVVQLGVHAALSRRRSRVQIPSGPLPSSASPRAVELGYPVG